LGQIADEDRDCELTLADAQRQLGAVRAQHEWRNAKILAGRPLATRDLLIIVAKHPGRQADRRRALPVPDHVEARGFGIVDGTLDTQAVMVAELGKLALMEREQ